METEIDIAKGWADLSRDIDAEIAKRDRGGMTPAQMALFADYLAGNRALIARFDKENRERAVEEERLRRKRELESAIAAEERTARQAAAERDQRLSALRRDLEAI